MDENMIAEKSKMKAAILLAMALLFIIFCSRGASAGTTSKVSGSYYNDDTFLLNDKICIVNIPSDERVVIDYGGTFIVVNNNTCKRVVNDEFCIDSISYDVEREQKKAQISIVYIGPAVEITRRINKSDPVIGEGVKITVRIDNTGNITATNVTFIDIFPQEIEVLAIKKLDARKEKVLLWGNDTGVWQNATKISWRGEIKRDSYVEFYYTLKPVKYIDSAFAARIIYNDGTKNIEKISPSVSIKTSSFFEIAEKFAPTDFTVDADSTTVIAGEDKSEIYVGEEAIFITEIKNNALKNETINISYIDFYIPNGLLYKGPASFKVYTNMSNPNETYYPGIHTLKYMGGNLYRWSGLMNPDGLIFGIKLKGVKKGKNKVTVHAKLVQFKEKKTREYIPLYEEDYYGSEETEVRLKDPVIDSNIKDGQTFDASQKSYFSVYIYNPNEFVNFTKLKVQIESPWLTKNFGAKDMRVGNYINLFDGFVEMPAVTESTAKKFKVNVTYDTEYGQTYSLKFERSVAIKPHSPIKISYLGSPLKGSTLDSITIGNEEVFLTVKLLNSGNSKIEHVNVTQITDPAITKESNITRIVNIDKGVMMDVLKYKINPPDSGALPEYLISTRVDYVAANETYHVVKDMKVEVIQKKMSMTATKKIQGTIMMRGSAAYVDYSIENTNDEPLKNVTIIFPTSQDFDIIGSRYHTLNKMEKKEIIAVIGKEKMRSKINGTSVRFPRADIIFHDEFGNEFRANSSEAALEVIYGPFFSPAIRLKRNISSALVNQSERFTVSMTLENIGDKGAIVTLNDFGKRWDIEIDAGRNKTLSYEAAESRTGDVMIDPAFVNYTYGREVYYAFSNKNAMTVNEVLVEGKKEEKPGEKAPELTPEQIEAQKKANAYLKYLYLVMFIAIICLVLFSVIRMKPKEKRFEFVKD